MRILLFLSTFFLLFPLFGQEGGLPLPTKHQITFGGSLWATSSKESDSDNKSSEYTIRPYALIQLDDHWQFGLCATYGRLSQQQELQFNRNTTITGRPFRPFGSGDTFIFWPPFPNTTITRLQETTINQYGFCAFGRYTINPAQRLNFFFEPSFGANFRHLQVFRERIAGTVMESFTRNVMFMGTMGLSYRFTPHWRITAFMGALGYTFDWDKEEAEDRYELRRTGAFFNFRPNQLRFAVEFTL